MQRREWIALTGLGSAGWLGQASASGLSPSVAREVRDLRITGLRITPVALPDPPILFSGGAHGPYFLRTILELETNAGIVGLAETRCSDAILKALEKIRPAVIGENPCSWRKFGALAAESGAAFAGLELACLDAVGRATGLRLCELLGGPVREEVEFASYLFYRYAADHPRVLDDPQLCDDRGRGEQALDPWGEVLTPEAMADLAVKFKQRWGFRFHKLKGGVLSPDEEIETLRLMQARLGPEEPLRIDPNARWTVPTAVRVGEQLKSLALDYYEDPVAGQKAMAEVRKATGLKISTNMCVTRVEHLADAVVNQPVDIVLLDHHSFGGLATCQAVATVGASFGWAFSQHSNNHAGITMAAMITLGAIVPQLTYASDTHYVWLPEGHDLIVGPNLPIRDGKMSVPRGAGLGVEIDRAKLAIAHERYRKSGMRGREDASKMLRFNPDWKPRMW